MGRGDHPNSRANLEKGRKFNSRDESARKAGQKGNESQRFNASFKAAGKAFLTDEKVTEMFDAMQKKAKSGDVSAFKALYDVMGEAQADTAAEKTINIAYLAPVLPAEEPPDD